MAVERYYEQPDPDVGRRSAPAALRNREPIAEVLDQWLPGNGLVLEVASGTGEHVVFLAERFPHLEWQPSDLSDEALLSITSWWAMADLENIRPPLRLDSAAPDWPVARADALLNVNMVHISPWQAALGLLDGAERLLRPGSPMILYGPWLADSIETAPSNLAFDADLRRRNPEWGLRRVEDFTAEAELRGLAFAETRAMPANNLMLLYRRR